MQQKSKPLLSRVYRYGKWLIGAWIIAFIAVTFYLYYHSIPPSETELSGAPNTEAAQVQEILTQDFNLKLGGTAAIVLPARESVQGLASFLSDALPEIQKLEPVNTDKAHALQLLKVTFKTEYPLGHLHQKTADIRRLLKQWRPNTKALVTGSTAFQYDTRVESTKDSRRSESLALFVSLGVLILTFGALSTAILPLIMGASALLFFHGLMAYTGSSLSPVSRILTSLVGLALNIDYALFVVSRFREERRAGGSLFTAWSTTIDQTGRTVLFSGLIMLVSLSVLLIPDVSLSRHLMLHLILIILLTLSHALILLPLCLVYGDRYWHWPAFLSRWIDQQTENSRRFWHTFSAHVVNHALPYFCLSLLCILALVWPLQDFKIWSPVNAIAPRQAESTRAYTALREDSWGGELLPIIVVYKHTNVISDEALSVLYGIHQRLVENPDVYRVQSLVGKEPLAVYQTLYNGLQTLGFFGAPESLRQLIIPENPQQTLLYVFPRNTEDPAIHERIMQQLAQEQQRLQTGTLLRGGVVARVNDFTRELYRELSSHADTHYWRCFHLAQLAF